MQATTVGASMQQQWFLKGDKLRFQEARLDAENGAMIFDAKKKVMYSIRHDEKMYMEISTDDPSKSA